MGNSDRLNLDIGKNEFDSIPIASEKDRTCLDNCELVTKECDTLTQTLSELNRQFGLVSIKIKCPMEYFRCDKNIVVNDKLVSGYYSDQKLKDHTIVDKPLNQRKCSHGGVFDATSYLKPLGGINKDSGFLIFSPSAHLHLIAANLAINHTEYFFNEIRRQIGDEEFSKFLGIKKLKLRKRDYINRHFQVCSATRNSFSMQFMLAIFIIILLL